MGKRGAGAASSGGGRSAKKPKTAASGRPLFFIAPGAGGELAADKPGEAARSIKTLLAEIGDVAGPMDKPPMGGGGCSAKALAAFQTAVEGVCADHPGRDVWLATQSFGGRLAVHTTIGGIENRDATGKPKPWPEARSLPGAVKGIIAFGYPLYHAKQNRGAPLLELPKGTRMMFVMGEKDETALGKPVNKALLTSKHYNAPFAQRLTVCTHHCHHLSAPCAGCNGRDHLEDGGVKDCRAAVGAIGRTQSARHAEDTPSRVKRGDPASRRSVHQLRVTE